MRAIVLGFLLTIVLNAGPISLVPVTGHGYRNSGDNPCIFYGPGACPDQPAGLSYSGPTDGDGFDLSRTYTAAEIRGAVGDTFFLALGVNQGNQAQTLLLLEVGGVNGGPFSIANISVPVQNHGAPWPDYLIGAGGTALGTLIPFSIAGASSAAQVSFRFALDGNDGPDKLFLVSAPEPATIILTGMSLCLLAAFARFRLRRAH